MLPTLPALPPRPEIAAPALPDAGGAAAAEAAGRRPFARALREAVAAPPEAADRRATRTRARDDGEGGPRERGGAPRSGTREARNAPAHKPADERSANAAVASAATDDTKAVAPGDVQPADGLVISDRALPSEGAGAATAAGEDAPNSREAAAADLPPAIDLSAAGHAPRRHTDGPATEDADARPGRTGGLSARGPAARHGLAADNPSGAAARFEPGSAADERAAAPSRTVAAPGDAERGLSPRGAVALDAPQTGPRTPATDATTNTPPVALAATAVSERPALALQPTLTGTGGAMAQAQLSAAPGSAEFAPALGGQLAVWLREGVQEAQLQLHPAELGPVAVHIAIDGLQAQVDFHAAHARTREAIEASLPALAAALRDAGFTLAGGGVFGQGAGEPGARRTHHTEHGDAQGSADAAARFDGDPMHRALPGSGWRRGLLDVFA